MPDLPEEHVTALEQHLAARPTSPLFARLAGYYLQMGRAEDALRLCNDGLAHHPTYSTAYLIKGKALLALQMPAEAKREFGIVNNFLPGNQTVADLYTGIDVPEPAEGPTIVEEPSPVAEASPEEQPFTQAVEEPPQVFEEEAQVVTAPVEEQQPSPFGGEEDQQAGFAPVEEQQPSPFGEPQTGEAFPTFGEVAQPSETAGVEDFGGMTAQETSPAEAPTQPVIPTYDEADPLAALRSDSGEDAFSQPPVTTEPAAVEPAASPTDYFDAFSQLQQISPEQESAPADTTGADLNPFEAFGAGSDAGGEVAAPAMSEGESFEEFAARTRMELFGTENTMTLEEYLGATSAGPATPAPDQIGELAEKLKTPKKITPVINFSEKETRKASEAGTDAGSGFVTPTLAEIYAKQGWYDDAIKAYKTLALNKPAEREKYEQRIAELEELKSKQ
ncbi:MAG: hypothetical protein HYZ01_06920 [Ignavibacteriales bacterium]|nr:hypothetical protein [Ignavibacteriales bacterium]